MLKIYQQLIKLLHQQSFVYEEIANGIVISYRLSRIIMWVTF